jgi:sigma-E factor negative regulatory protein RseC
MSCETVQAEATVLRVEAGRVEIAVAPRHACTACAEKAGCASKDAPPRTRTIWLASEMALTPGQKLAVAVPQDQVLRSALWMYGLPLAGFIAGLLAGAVLGEKSALGGALIGLVAGFALASHQSRRWISPLRLLQGEKND